MNKYKAVGIVNLLIGGVEIFWVYSTLFFTIPQLKVLYSELNINVSTYFTTAYIILTFVLITSVINIFLGFKLFSNLEKVKDKYFGYGIIFLCISLVLFGFFVGTSAASIVNPIYNLVGELEK